MPTVTGVSLAGSTLTITGSAFGVGKVAPLLWDDFEGGTNGAAIGATPKVGSWDTATGPLPRAATTYTTAQAFGGTKSLTAPRTAGEYGNFAVVLPDAQRFYQSFRFRYTKPAGIGQVRLAEVWGTYRVGDYNPGVLIGSDGATWSARLALENSGTASATTFTGPSEGAWHHFEAIFQQSDVGAANGRVTVKIDGVTVLDANNVVTRERAGERWERAHFLSAMTGFLDDSAVTWIDDAYINDSWTRVELGDASTYAACTKRAIQPLTTWADGSITATLNSAGFSAGATVYAYVTDASGVVNATGSAISLSGTPAALGGVAAGQITASGTLESAGVVLPASFRALTTTTYTSRTNTVVTVPAGVAAGDLLLMIHSVGGSAGVPAITTPTGWTLVSGFPAQISDGSFTVVTRLFWRVASSSEPANYTLTHSPVPSQGLMFAVTGASGVAPTVSIASGVNASGGAGASTTVPGVSAGAGALILFAAHNWELYGSGTVPSGTTPTLTERVDSSTSLWYAASGVMSAAGSTGTIIQSPNGNLANGAWLGMVLAAEPVVVAPPVQFTVSALASAVATASLSVGARLASSATAGVTASGELRVGALLGGVAAASGLATATLTGSRAALSGAASASILAAATLTGARAVLSGAAAASASSTGSLTSGSAALSGAAQSSVSASATLTGARAVLSSSASGTASATGSLVSSSASLVGDVQASVSVAGTLSDRPEIQGSGTATVIASASLATSIRIDGSALASATASAVMNAGPGELSGSTVARIVGAGTLATKTLLVGATSATTTAQAVVSTVIRLGGTATVSALAAGDMLGGTLLRGDATASVGSAGALATAVRLSATPTVSAVAAGGLGTVAAALSGAASLLSVASAALTIESRVSGASVASLTAGASLSTAILVSGAAVVQSSVAGRLDSPAAGPHALFDTLWTDDGNAIFDTAYYEPAIWLEGAANVSGVSDASLAVTIRLEGAALASVVTAAQLAQYVDDGATLVATASARVIASAAITTDSRLTADATAFAISSAGLATSVSLAGDTQARLLADGRIEFSVSYYASALARIDAAGILSTQVTLGGVALSRVIASAFLTVPTFRPFPVPHRMAATALRMIARHGRSLTLRIVDQGDYDSGSGAVVQNLTDYASVGVRLDYEQRYIDGTVIRAGDQKLLMPPQDIPRPLTGHQILMGGRTYRVVSVGEVAPNGDPALYELQLRGVTA